ncbi:MAG TPA: glycosyltransferase family 39 protein [bacterium]|nr:glycosyltransferase family 39 protein [bacterium]
MRGEKDSKRKDRERGKRARLLLGVFVVAALWIRVYRVGEPIGGYHAFNEAWYALIASNYDSVKDFLFPISVQGHVDYNVTPLLSYLLYFSCRAFGWTVAAMRAVPILFSVATLPLLYLLGKRLFGRRAGLAAAAFYGFMPMPVIVGRNIQTDALYVFMMLASLLLYMAAREKERGTSMWILCAGFVFGLAFMCKQFAVFLVPAVFLWELIRNRGMKWLGWEHAVFALGALAANLPFFGYHFLFNRREMITDMFNERQVAMPGGADLGYIASECFWGFSPLIFMLLIVSIIFFVVFRRRRSAVLPLVSIAVFLAFFLFVNMHSYYLMFTVPFVCLLAGGLIQEKLTVKGTVVIAGTIIAACLFQSLLFMCSVKYGYGEFEAVGKMMAERDRPVIVAMNNFAGSYFPVISYYVKDDASLALESDVVKDGGKSDFGDREVFLLGFAYEDDDRMPPARIYIRRPLYGLEIFGRTFVAEPMGEHFFRIDGVKTLKTGNIFDTGIKTVAWERSLVLGAVEPGHGLDIQGGRIDFRSPVNKNLRNEQGR